MIAFHSVLLLLVAQAQGSWSDLGGSKDPGVSGAGTAALRGVLAVDHHDRPLVAWWDNSTGNLETYVRRWDGVSGWPGLGNSAAPGGVSTTTGASSWPSLAVDATDNPIVTWIDNTSGIPTVYLRRWTGTAWTGMGGSDASVAVSSNSGTTTYPAVAVSPAGKVVVAWSENVSGTTVILVRTWNGSAWVGIDGTAASESVAPASGGSQRAQLAFGLDGQPVVSWAYGGFVYLKRWTGTQWVEVAGSATGAGISPGEPQGIDTGTTVRLKIDTTGTIYVAWRAIAIDGNNDTCWALHLKRWIPGAASWTALGGSATGAGASVEAAPAEGIGNIGIGLAIDSVNRPMVAYPLGVSHAVILRRWDGTSWADLGGSTTGTGVAKDVTSVNNVAVAVDSWDRPVVSWSDTSTGTSQVYLSRYNPPATAPLAPSQLKQLALNGVTPIPNGASADRQGLKFGAFVDDVNGESIALQVDLQPLGTPFSGDVAGATAFLGAQGPAHGPATLTVSGLPDGVAWQWRARAIDGGGLASEWVVAPDGFSTPSNGAPSAASVEQVQVWDRGVISTLIVRARVVDPEGDLVKFETEVRRVDEPFTGTPTQQGDFVDSGSTIELTIFHMLDGLYKWRYQVRDSLGKPSGWISYGGNSDSDADFSFPPFGSSGNAKCTGSAAGSAAGSALLVTVLAAVVVAPRRR